MAKVENRILTDLVYEKLKSMILDGDLPPGEKIRKQELADLLGVSQTPINDAVSRLAGEKYIEQRSRQGFFVKVYTREDLRDLFAVRAGLEGIAIRLCIENANDACLDELIHCFDGFSPPLSTVDRLRYTDADRCFHERIITLSGNMMIGEIDHTFGYIVKCYRKGLIRPPEETCPEHAAITAAIIDRDAHRAQELVIRHHLRTREVLETASAGVPDGA